MRALVQRVDSAQVECDGKTVGRIGGGLLVYLGVGTEDGLEHVDRLAEKIAHLRIFQDEQGNMNLSARDVRGDVLVIPNFTLMADARKGRRPSLAAAGPPSLAEPIYEKLVESLKKYGGHVAGGAFGQRMTIRSVAEGPVNVLVEYPPPEAPTESNRQRRDT